MGIEGKLVFNTREELGSIEVVSDKKINVKDRFFNTVFKNKNFLYEESSLRPVNQEVLKYLKDKKG